MVKLKRATFKYIESELYMYHETKQEINEIREEIIHASPLYESESVKSSRISDPTARKATALVTNRKLGNFERIVDAIEQVYQTLPSEQQKLVQLRYWTKPQLLDWNGIIQKANISRTQAFVWRRQIINAIAEELGSR